MIGELNSLVYIKVQDMCDHLDSFCSLLDRVSAMDATICEDLVVVMIFGYARNFYATVEALTTLQKLDWHDVCSRLIEVSKTTRATRH